MYFSINGGISLKLELCHSPGSDDTDIDEGQLRIAVVTLTKGFQQPLRIGDKSWIAEIRNEGFAVGYPLAFDPFGDQPVGNFRSRLRIVEHHHPQTNVHCWLMVGGDAKGVIDQIEIIDPFLWLKLAPVEAIVLKTGIGVLGSGRFFTIAIMKAGDADARIDQQTIEGGGVMTMVCALTDAVEKALISSRARTQELYAEMISPYSFHFVMWS